MAKPALGGSGITKPLTVVVLLLAVIVSACSVTPPAARPERASVEAPPEWRPGDRWIYRWDDGARNGTRTVEVLESRQVGEGTFYVLKMTDSEFLSYWTVELGWAGVVAERDSRVQARVDPPMPWFSWPLEVGRQWNHRGVYEDRTNKRELNESFMVVGAESVEVPAGRFDTLKIVREGKSADSDQYWYAPQARSYVKWILKRGERRIEEELTEYKPAERLIPGPAKAKSVPK